MRTPFLKEPLPAPWWAFIYTLHHKMWCELHYGPSWYRKNFKKLEYDTHGGIVLVGLGILASYGLAFLILTFLGWLLIW